MRITSFLLILFLFPWNNTRMKENTCINNNFEWIKININLSEFPLRYPPLFKSWYLLCWDVWHFYFLVQLNLVEETFPQNSDIKQISVNKNTEYIHFLKRKLFMASQPGSRNKLCSLLCVINTVWLLNIKIFKIYLQSFNTSQNLPGN